MNIYGLWIIMLFGRTKKNCMKWEHMLGFHFIFDKRVLMKKIQMKPTLFFLLAKLNDIFKSSLVLLYHHHHHFYIFDYQLHLFIWVTKNIIEDKRNSIEKKGEKNLRNKWMWIESDFFCFVQITRTYW